VTALLRFLVLSGPTREYLDPVRFLSNASSGRQGHAIARAALSRGHAVTLVEGPVASAPPPGAEVVPVTSALDMLAAAKAHHPSCDVLVAAAAVSDWRPARRLDRKHKREPGASTWTIELVANPDIAVELGRAKETRLHIGFALETDNAIENARKKLERKRFDWLLLDSPDAIDRPSGEYTLLGADGTLRSLGKRLKEEIAELIVDLAERRSLPRD